MTNLYTGEEARTKIMRGVDTIADAVRGTLGAGGYNGIIESHLPPYSIVTNDGVSIAQAIQLEDPVEQIGANLIKEIATKSDKDSGDGTTTATVLAQAILHSGGTFNAHPMDISRSLDECLPFIYASLDEQKKEITPDTVAQVATVSAEDPVIGNLVGEIYQVIGKDGIIELDTSNLPETFYTITEGVRLRGAGYLGAYSTTEPGKAVYTNPKILIAKDKITTLEDIEPIVKALAQTGVNELVIYCDEIDLGTANRLALTHLNGGFKTLIIKAPTLWKDWITEDFARITGATIVDTAEGVSFRSLLMSHLGTCEKIITTDTETRVIGIQDISAYLARLNESGDDKSKLRASWLQTKVATLKLGANTETELSYIMKKAEDARSAAYFALQDGIVAGGGVALLNAISTLPDTVGGQILSLALTAPILQIIENAGDTNNGSTLVGLSGGPRGYDARTGEVVDMWETGIVDPAKIVKNSIKNAISVAGKVLTTRVVVTAPKQPAHANTSQMPGL